MIICLTNFVQNFITFLLTALMKIGNPFIILSLMTFMKFSTQFFSSRNFVYVKVQLFQPVEHKICTKRPVGYTPSNKQPNKLFNRHVKCISFLLQLHACNDRKLIFFFM